MRHGCTRGLRLSGLGRLGRDSRLLRNLLSRYGMYGRHGRVLMHVLRGRVGLRLLPGLPLLSRLRGILGLGLPGYCPHFLPGLDLPLVLLQGSGALVVEDDAEAHGGVAGGREAVHCGGAAQGDQAHCRAEQGERKERGWKGIFKVWRLRVCQFMKRK